MRAFIFTVLFCACSSSPTENGVDAPLQGSADAATATTGFKLNLGSSYVSTKPVTISAAKTSGVYAGYFQAQSDPASVPGISVHIHASNAELSSGMQVLAREHHVELVVARLAAHAGEPVRENADWRQLLLPGDELASYDRLLFDRGRDFDLVPQLANPALTRHRREPAD